MNKITFNLMSTFKIYYCFLQSQYPIYTNFFTDCRKLNVKFLFWNFPLPKNFTAKTIRTLNIQN